MELCSLMVSILVFCILLFLVGIYVLWFLLQRY